MARGAIGHESDFWRWRESFRLMGFEEGELDFCGQSYTQLSKRAGNGWDVNLAGQLLRHIFRQMRSLPSFD